MTDYAPIHCDDYDVLELACLDRYSVDVVTRDGRFSGLAADLRVAQGEEFLQLKHPDGSSSRIRIDRIRKITVTTRPSRLEEHVFANATK